MQHPEYCFLVGYGIGAKTGSIIFTQKTSCTITQQSLNDIRVAIIAEDFGGHDRGQDISILAITSLGVKYAFADAPTLHKVTEQRSKLL